jgi:hypothetical protein
VAQRLVDLVDYEEGRVVSRTFEQNPSISITLFAFDNGEGVSTHTAPGDTCCRFWGFPASFCSQLFLLRLQYLAWLSFK